MNDDPDVNLAAARPGQVKSFVIDLYRIFYDRAPDPGGLDVCVRRLSEGMPIKDLIAVFRSSEEFTQRAWRSALLELAQAGAFERSDSAEAWFPSDRFPEDYHPPGEAGRSYLQRLRTGFLDRYCSGPVVLDVGYSGYNNPEGKTAIPGAKGIDLDSPGYDGLHLPFADATVDTVFSSHCLEHVLYDHAAIQEWYRVLKTGGFIVCIVPSQALYEKKKFLPSRFNEDHKRMYTPSSLAASFEVALEVNSYRLRHLAENDRGFNYELGPETHSNGAYEIELVIEKISPPSWKLA